MIIMVSFSNDLIDKCMHLYYIRVSTYKNVQSYNMTLRIPFCTQKDHKKLKRLNEKKVGKFIPEYAGSKSRD
jgi:hypothetical protein